ncbi:MAG: hypothetical protein ACRDG7_01765 [Candidatus Limnocylindria bacterium]
MSTGPRAVLIALVVLAAVVVGLLVLQAGGAPIGLGPADVTPSPLGSPASASPTPSAASVTSPSPDALTTSAQIEAAVVEIRGLPAAEIGPPDMITRADLQKLVRANPDLIYPPAEREADNITYHALGLLEPGEDVGELQLSLLEAALLGFYDDDPQGIVVVTDMGLDANAKYTYAHEYTHALQDAALMIDSLELDPEGVADRSLAHAALLEGDAELTAGLWAVGGGLRPDEHDEVDELDDLLRATPGVPDWMISKVIFPYTTGLTWVQQIWSEGGFAAVDEAWASPPDSTEQVIHFEKWADREEPIAVSGPALAEALGPDWRQVESTPVGEATIGIVLEHFGVDPDAAAEAAAGWGGDRLTVAAAPDGAFALAWIIAWDSPSDADEFSEAYQAALDALPFPADLVEMADGRTLVAHASHEALLTTTIDAAGG